MVSEEVVEEQPLPEVTQTGEEEVEGRRLPEEQLHLPEEAHSVEVRVVVEEHPLPQHTPAPQEVREETHRELLPAVVVQEERQEQTTEQRVQTVWSED